MNRKHFSFITLSAICLFFFASCGGKKKDDPNHIIVGVESGPEYVVAKAAQKVAKEKYGLDVELVQFNDFIMPNTALQQGDIDVNAYVRVKHPGDSMVVNLSQALIKITKV